MGLLDAGQSQHRSPNGHERSRNGGNPTLRLRDTDTPPTPSRRASLRNIAKPYWIAGLALVLIALAGYLAVYNSTTKRTPVLVVARDLPAGTVLRSSDLRVGELAGDRNILAGLVPDRQLDQVVGRRLASPLTAGAPLPDAALARPVQDTAAFTMTLPAIRTGALEVGDRVTVLATYDAGSGHAHTSVVGRDLQILGLGSATGAIDRDTATVPVVLAVPDPSIAADLALSNDDARVSLLLEGRQTTTRIPPATEQTR